MIIAWSEQHDDNVVSCITLSAEEVLLFLLFLHGRIRYLLIPVGRSLGWLHRAPQKGKDVPRVPRDSLTAASVIEHSGSTGNSQSLYAPVDPLVP